MRILTPIVAVAVTLAVLRGDALAKGDPKQAKINVYVEILNQWSTYVFKQRDDYASWVDLAKGPTCTESKLRGPSAIGPTAKTTFATYAKALKKGPKLPADAAAQKMVATLIALWQPTFEASEYYYKRAFKDDGCKRGQELHVVLIQLWTEYVEAEREVRAFVVTFNDDREITALAKTQKKYGTRLRYHYEKLIIDGKALVREIDAALATDPPTVGAIGERLTAFVATFDAATALVEAARPDSRIYDVLYQGGYTQFMTRAGWYREAVDRLVKVLADPTAASFARDLERANKESFDAYNTMIDGANDVRLSPKIK